MRAEEHVKTGVVPDDRELLPAARPRQRLNGQIELQRRGNSVNILIRRQVDRQAVLLLRHGQLQFHAVSVFLGVRGRVVKGEAQPSGSQRLFPCPHETAARLDF